MKRLAAFNSTHCFTASNPLQVTVELYFDMNPCVRCVRHQVSGSVRKRSISSAWKCSWLLCLFSMRTLLSRYRLHSTLHWCPQPFTFDTAFKLSMVWCTVKKLNACTSYCNQTANGTCLAFASDCTRTAGSARWHLQVTAFDPLPAEAIEEQW